MMGFRVIYYAFCDIPNIHKWMQPGYDIWHAAREDETATLLTPEERAHDVQTEEGLAAEAAHQVDRWANIELNWRRAEAEADGGVGGRCDFPRVRARGMTPSLFLERWVGGGGCPTATATHAGGEDRDSVHLPRHRHRHRRRCCRR